MVKVVETGKERLELLVGGGGGGGRAGARGPRIGCGGGGGCGVCGFTFTSFGENEVFVGVSQKHCHGRFYGKAIFQLVAMKALSWFSFEHYW